MNPFTMQLFTIISLLFPAILFVASSQGLRLKKEHFSPKDHGYRYLLVFANELENASSSNWSMIAIDVTSGKTHTVLEMQRTNSPAMCAFALADASTVSFYNFNNGVVMETWSLMTGNRTSSLRIVGSYLQTVDYNPDSRNLEGICEILLPQMNMTSTCWCAIHGNSPSDVYQVPTAFLGETRADCSGYLDDVTDTFWYAAAWYNHENRFFVGLPTNASSTGRGWKWFGALNGTAGLDGYAHDNIFNRSFGIQIGPDNVTSQLIEILPGAQPYLKDNPPPKVIHIFRDGFGLSKAGLVAYNSELHHMYAIMQHNPTETASPKEQEMRAKGEGTGRHAQYLVKIDMVLLEVKRQEIKWPKSYSGLGIGSMRFWPGLPEGKL